MTNIKYSENVDWEEWMNEYKFGAFYLFPPKGIIEEIDSLRKKYDPKSAAFCQAHISLSDPLTSPITDSQIEELKNILSRFEPFEVTYGPLKSLPPYPGVIYSIQPQDKLMQLRQIVHKTSIFKNSPLTRKDRETHLTIAEFISLEETEKLINKLQGKVPAGKFNINEIELAVPDSIFYFQRVLKLPLGR